MSAAVYTFGIRGHTLAVQADSLESAAMAVLDQLGVQLLKMVERPVVQVGDTRITSVRLNTPIRNVGPSVIKFPGVANL